MNSKSLQYSNPLNSAIEITVQRKKDLFGAIVRMVPAWSARSELKKAQAHYRIKRERMARIESQQDIVNSLSVEEKHRLGMYRFLD